MYHTIDICERVADNFKNLEYINTLAAQSRGVEGDPESFDAIMSDTLMGGMPGIAYCLFALHRNFPDKNWDQTAYSYLISSIQKTFSRKKVNSSLLTGLAGLATVTYFAAQQNTKFSKFLKQLEDVLVEKISKSFLALGSKYENHTEMIPPNYYNFANGLSGIFHYLLLRREDFSLHELMIRCLDQLSKVILYDKQIDGQSVPSWFISPDYLHEKERAWCPQGGVFLGFPLGISGCLSMLSMCAIKKCWTPHLLEAIEVIARWIKPYLDSPTTFGAILPLGREPVKNYDYERDNWSVGWPGVLRSLYLAGKATNDSCLTAFAEATYAKFLHDHSTKQTLLGPSFCVGKAGLLATSYLMGVDTANKRILQEVKQLELDIMIEFSPNHVFGFESMVIDKTGAFQRAHDPSLCFGSSGILLTLLLVQGRLKCFDNQIILSY